MSYCLSVFRIFVRAVFTKNMPHNSQKHVRVFGKHVQVLRNIILFWSTNYQSFTKEAYREDLFVYNY